MAFIDGIEEENWISVLEEVTFFFFLEADLMAGRALRCRHQAFSYSSYLEAKDDLEQA